jgi:hypothetical protein
LVSNIGLDSSGNHCEKTCRFDVCLAQAPVRVERLELVENIFARKCFASYFMASRSLVRRVFKKVMGWRRKTG